MKGLHYVMHVEIKIQPKHDGVHLSLIEMEGEDDIYGHGASVNQATAEALEILSKRMRARSAV